MSELIKVLILQNEIEADLMDNILNERDIPHIIRSYYDSAYDSLFQLQKGWGHIEAYQEDAVEIHNIYEEIKRREDWP